MTSLVCAFFPDALQRDVRSVSFRITKYCPPTVIGRIARHITQSRLPEHEHLVELVTANDDGTDSHGRDARLGAGLRHRTPLLDITIWGWLDLPPERLLGKALPPIRGRYVFRHWLQFQLPGDTFSQCVG